MKLICLIIEELGWTAPREVKSNNQLFFSLRMGRKDWFWFLFAEQRGPLAAYQLMKLIEWSQGCLMGWSCFWVGGWFGGLWALQRQWLRQRKQTQPNKSNEIQSNNAAAMKRKEWNWMNVMNEIEFLRLIGCSPHAEEINGILELNNERMELICGAATPSFIKKKLKLSFFFMKWAEWIKKYYNSIYR